MQKSDQCDDAQALQTQPGCPHISMPQERHHLGQRNRSRNLSFRSEHQHLRLAALHAVDDALRDASCASLYA